MINNKFDTLDYILSKEYASILLRRFQSIDRSYVRTILFNKSGKLVPESPMKFLATEIIELHNAMLGLHKHDGINTVKKNAIHEICDCIFYLMLLDISLGGQNYDDFEWVLEFSLGVEHPDTDSPLEDIKEFAYQLKTIDLTDTKNARMLIPKILNHLGRVASSEDIVLDDIVDEIICNKSRWSRKESDMDKRLRSIQYATQGAIVPRERSVWFRENMPTISKFIIDAVKEYLKT